MLKHCLLALLLAGLVCTISFSAVAQDSSNDQQSAPAGAPPEHGHRHFDPARRTEMLTKQLKLTSEQQPKVLDILKSEQSQMESLRSDASTAQADRRTKMMEIRQASSDQIRSLLDANQQKKWDAIQGEHRQWRGDHHDQQDSGTQPDSSQPQ